MRLSHCGVVMSEVVVWYGDECQRLSLESYGGGQGLHISLQLVKMLMSSYLCKIIIRESVDSLCRNDADTPIVRVHRKAFLTHKCSRSKPFWAPSYSIPAFFYPTIPPQVAKMHPLTYYQKTVQRSFCLSSYSSSLLLKRFL